MAMETLTGGDDTAPNDDLRSALDAAFEAPTEPEKETQPEASADEAKDSSRDEKERFASKSQDEEAQTPDTKTQTTEQSAEAPTVKPPVSWSKDTHEYWHSLPPAIQQEVLKREKDFERGLQQKAEKYKPYDEIEQVLAPRRQSLQARGLNEAQAIQRLFAAQEMLDRDPLTGLAQIAQSYGIDLGSLLQSQGIQNVPQVDPTVMQMQRQLQMLQAEREQEKLSRQQYEQSQIQTQIEAFKANPENDLFDLVKEDMAVLLQSERAKNLDEAYKMAVRMNDDAFRLWQAKEAAKRTPAPDPKIVQKAKAAASSVKGSPNGMTAADAPKASLREELEAQFGTL